jgi:AraC family transcriptional regulator of adaptative response / DNA-3-methyladenine glycosylase II
MPSLDADLCYRALLARDARFDGRFFTAVLSTGIYCRPICPARTPGRRNVRFYACAAAAESAGFRACRRCRPESAPGSPAWSGTSATVARALRLIDSGGLDSDDVESLAGRLGMTARHLRRLFSLHLGTTPVALAQARRVHFARRLLDETTLPITEIAQSAGFGSLRRFNDAFRRSFAASPSELRRKRVPVSGSGRATQSTTSSTTAAGGEIRLRLPFKAPCDVEAAFGFLGPRAIPGIERVEAGSLVRAARHGGCTAWVRLEPEGDGRHLRLVTSSALSGALQDLCSRARRLFDLDADPDVIASHLSRDRLLAPLVARHPGRRVCGAWDPFETSMRILLGQQVSVAAATTLSGRLVRSLAATPGSEGHAASLTSFPEPAAIASASLDDVGLPAARRRGLRAFAAAVAAGDLHLDASRELEATIAELRTVAGVGPWSAHMIAMRACADPDAFPDGDLALRRAMQALYPDCRTPARLRARSDAWRPWRAYAASLLWAWYADGLPAAR